MQHTQARSLRRWIIKRRQPAQFRYCTDLAETDPTDIWADMPVMRIRLGHMVVEYEKKEERDYDRAKETMTPLRTLHL